jgi:hypothetical protein
MNLIRVRDGNRNAALIAGAALLLAIATLPLTFDLMRTFWSLQKPERPARVTLTCFDNEMRPHSCDVVSTTLAATGSPP